MRPRVVYSVARSGATAFSAPEVQQSLVPSPPHAARFPAKTLLLHFADKYVQSSLYNHCIALCTGGGPFVHCNVLLSESATGMTDGRYQFIVKHEGGAWATYVGDKFKQRSVYCGKQNAGRETALFAIPVTEEAWQRLKFWLRSASGVGYSTREELMQCALPDSGQNEVLPYLSFTGRQHPRPNMPDRDLFLKSLRNRLFCSQALVLALQYAGVLPETLERVTAERVSPNRLFKLMAGSGENVHRISPDQCIIDLPQVPGCARAACPATAGVWVA